MLLRDISVRQLKGVGDKRARAYEKLGIHSVEDLLRHYPRTYEDWSKTVALSQAMPHEPCCVRAAGPD